MRASKKGIAGDGLMNLLKVEKTCEKFSPNHKPHFSYKKTTFKVSPHKKYKSWFFAQKNHKQGIPSIGNEIGDSLLPLPLGGGGSSKQSYIPSPPFLKGDSWGYQGYLEQIFQVFADYGSVKKTAPTKTQQAIKGLNQ